MDILIITFNLGGHNKVGGLNVIENHQFGGALFYIGLPKKVALITPDFKKLVALLTPALIGVNLIFKTGGIRAAVKGAGVKKGPAEKGPIRYGKAFNIQNCPLCFK